METPDRERPSPVLGSAGAFDLLVELASGGMATVFLARARDGRDAPLVAIKRPHRHLAGDSVFLSMLVDEARLASAIDHPNVVRVRELGFDGIEPFIVMDYVEGGSLSHVRQILYELGKTLEPRLALRIALDALAGLEAAHALRDENGRHLGIVHRDVSPHNVLVGCDGATRLTDFGIAKAADRVQVTRTHEVKGKLAYLAPERIDRRRICTPQSDVFSMSVVLWECIAGRRLFRGDEAIETLQEVVSAPIPSLRRLGAAISPELDEVILRGLARDLDRRYRTADELSAALQRAAGPNGVAKPFEVAELVEALFGTELRQRHEAIRGVLGARADVSHVLEVSGLSARPEPDEAARARERLRIEGLPPMPAGAAHLDLAPAPSGPSLLARPAVRKIAPVAVAASLLVLGAGWALLRRPAEAGARPATVASAAPAAAGELSAARRVVVTLPFAASYVTFDGKALDVPQATSAVVVDVPAGSTGTHQLVAVAPDGARAEASVVEDDGIAKPAGGGFVIETLETYDVGARPSAGGARPRPQRRAAGAPAAPSAPPPPASPIGTVKGGFTKIR